MLIFHSLYNIRHLDFKTSIKYFAELHTKFEFSGRWLINKYEVKNFCSVAARGPWMLLELSNRLPLQRLRTYNLVSITLRKNSSRGPAGFSLMKFERKQEMTSFNRNISIHFRATWTEYLAIFIKIWWFYFNKIKNTELSIIWRVFLFMN